MCVRVGTWFLAITLTLQTGVELFAAPVDYLREIRPLLSQNCYQCHGASQQKHGLRLDTAALAVKGGEHGPAILPGRSDASLLVQVLMGHPL